MKTIVIENVPIAELPVAWQAKLQGATDAKVTVRMDQEDRKTEQRFHDLSNNPMEGMWSDREDIRDAAAYVRKLRESRYLPDGSRNQQ
jgi:hypothetical protein